MAIIGVKVINPRNPQGPRSRFYHERLESPSHFDRRSLRTIVPNAGERVIVGCPKGHYSARMGRCKVGTRAQAILYPKMNSKRRNQFLPGLIAGESLLQSIFSPKSNPRRRKRRQSTFGGALETSFWGRASPRKRRRRNQVLPGLIAADVLGGTYEKAKAAALETFKSVMAKPGHSHGATKRAARKLKKKLRKKARTANPHLALIGSVNPRGGTKMHRDSKGRFIKPRRKRSRGRKRSFKRRNSPKIVIRYRNRTKTRVRRIYVRANRKRSRKYKRASPRRHNQYRAPYKPPSGVYYAPRRAYSTTPTRSNRRRRHRSHRRRNIGVRGLIPSMPQITQIVWAAAGGFIGSKATGIIMDKVIPATVAVQGGALIRTGVGLVVTALAWRVNPAFGLGAGVGALSNLTDQLFNWAWGIQSGYTGISGLKDFVHPGYKLEPPGWTGGAPAMHGLGINRLIERKM